VHSEGIYGCLPTSNGVYRFLDWLRLASLLDVPYDAHNVHIETLYGIPGIPISRALDKRKVDVDALHVDIEDENGTVHVDKRLRCRRQQPAPIRNRGKGLRSSSSRPLFFDSNDDRPTMMILGAKLHQG